MGSKAGARKRDLAKIQLSCHHETWYAKPYPEAGDEVYCIRCNDVKEVLVTPDSEGNFGFHCSCGYSRRHGAAKLQCETKASAHHVKYPHHTMELLNGSKVYHVYRANQRPDDVYVAG